MATAKAPARVATRPRAPASPASPFRPVVNRMPGLPAGSPSRSPSPVPGAPPLRVPARPSPPQAPQQTTSPDGPRSSLAKAVEDRGRRFRVFPLSGFWGVGGKAIERVGILYGTDRDSEAAVLAAHAYLAQLEPKHRAPGASGDLDLLGATKLRELLFRVCRGVDPRRPEQLALTANGLHAYPGFPSPTWMRDNLGPDEIAVLLRLVDEVRREFAPRPPDGGEPWGLDDEAVGAIAMELVEAQRVGDVAGARLAHLPRSAVTLLCVRLAERLERAELARDALLAGAPVLAASSPAAAPPLEPP